MPELPSLTTVEHAALQAVLATLRVDHKPVRGWRWRLLFALKAWCDRHLYGATQVPSKCCPGCGLSTVGQRLNPPYHAACAPPHQGDA